MERLRNLESTPESATLKECQVVLVSSYQIPNKPSLLKNSLVLCWCWPCLRQIRYCIVLPFELPATLIFHFALSAM